MFGRLFLIAINLHVIHVALSTGHSCDQLLSNGDFEENQIAQGSYRNQIPNGWSSVSSDIFSTLTLVGNKCWAWGSGTLAPSGNVYLAAQSANFESQQGIQQTVILPKSLVGSSLVLSFYASSRIDGYASTTMAVTVNDGIIMIISLFGYFKYYSVVIPITSTTFNLKFVDTSLASTVHNHDPRYLYYHAFLLDKISLIPQSCLSGSSQATNQDEMPSERQWSPLSILSVVFVVLCSVILLACIIWGFYKLHKVSSFTFLNY